MLPRPNVRRFLLVTLGITGLYLGLNALWLALTPALEAVFESRTESDWEREAAGVASAAREADGRLAPEWRLAAYRLGFHVGYCSNVLGSVALSSPEAQAQVREILAPRLQGIEVLARQLGLGEVSLLPVTNVDEFGYVNDRLDADELGLAARVEHATSRRHRHLLLLGMHVGVAAALADISGGKLQNPLRRYIGHHATAAHVPAGRWEPAARVHEAATPEQSAKAYQEALAALEIAIAQLEPLPSADRSR
jgi:hypothetical protein